MNKESLQAIYKKLNLDAPINSPIRIHGGLLHRMWRINSGNSSFAVKQLNKDIKLTEAVKKQYELTEEIAYQFSQKGIPAISAIKIEGKHLIEIASEAFLIYPWIQGSVLSAISQPHALKIPSIVAKMHGTNLDFPELIAPEFNIHSTEKIVTLINKAAKHRTSFINELKINQHALIEINDAYQKALPLLHKTSTISHGDLDPKNVLWDKHCNPILIDWESARKLNPTYEMINCALDWSGITSNNFNKSLFIQMLKAYINAGGTIDKENLLPVFYGVLGNWLNWLIYNIKRSCKTEREHSEQQKLGIEQAHQVLPIILQLESMVLDLTHLVIKEL